MLRTTLAAEINQKNSYLCVGLDTDERKLPRHLKGKPNAVVEFNKAIIDATKQCCVSYKINTAFYEAAGKRGWEAMEETLAYIPEEHFKIADAKRADIGNTSDQYARAFFETLKFDAVTVAPYMGEDSVRPFLQYKDKWTIVLALTSNRGAQDFETLRLDCEGSTTMVYEKVLTTASRWGSTDNLMFVVGATQAGEIGRIRNLVPEHFLLVPGVGFQGGSLADVSAHGLIEDCGLLVNASRAIIYASSGEDFAEEAKEIASQYQNEMRGLLSKVDRIKRHPTPNLL